MNDQPEDQLNNESDKQDQSHSDDSSLKEEISDESNNINTPEEVTKSKLTAKENFRRLFTKHKAVWIIIGVLLLIGLLIVGYLGYKKQINKNIECDPTRENCNSGQVDNQNSTSGTNTPAIPQVASYLNGALVDQNKEYLRPLAVMIENYPEARPQSGLSSADLVYEAIAEGGITRFMAVYGDPTHNIKVGPIRSARTYFVDFADELKALYAHVGGAEDALNQIQNTPNFHDLNQFSIGEPVFQRDYSKNVSLEHTMYSTTLKLWNYAIDTKKWSKGGEYTKWKFGTDIDTANRPATQNISVKVSDTLYDVEWVYNPENNSYKRNLAGKAHIDANNNTQIEAKNIILQKVARTAKSGEKGGWNYQLEGSGVATIINNGQVTQGKWIKEEGKRTKYFDAQGVEVSLVPGQIWVEIVHTDSVISF